MRIEKQMKNNRKKKILLKVLIVFFIIVIILLVIIGFFYFRGQLSPEKKEYENLLASQTKTMTDEMVLEIDRATKEVKEQTVGTEAALYRTANLTLEEKNKIEGELTAKYYDLLMTQKQKAISMLNQLLEQAKSEYQSMSVDQKQDPFAKGDFISLYLAKIDTMESQMDGSFDTILKHMEEQLKAEGIDSDPIMNNYKKTYQQIKEENRKTFMNKAKSVL